MYIRVLCIIYPWTNSSLDKTTDINFNNSDSNDSLVSDDSHWDCHYK